ncbi:MAG: hypothetical protein H0T76_19710 [Nannocystis sp.]|nr:hypothetical protein [Nannocystis sp.]MBA3548719.1 hypothetical protein [Nannocystis sp.]
MRNTTSTSTSCVLLTVMLCACGDDQGAGAEAGNEDPTTGGESTGAEPTTGEPEPEPFVAFPARGGIKISKVEANPGVAVPIGKAGAEVSGAERNAFIPRERDTLIRVYLDTPDDWVERELEARLLLTVDGVDTTLTQKLLISADSRESGLNSGFFFGVPKELMRPGLRYQVALWETDFGQEDLPEPAEPASLPFTGTAFVGVESGNAEMRVVLVPVDYSFGSCKKVVDGEAHKEAFEDGLFQQNAVKNVEFTIRAPYKVAFDMTSFNGLSKLVSEISQLRTADGADPNVYYYGLFDNCGTCIGDGGIGGGCTVGLAADITGDGMSDGRFRAAVGQLNGGAAETFVHEIGHTQGRRHIACSGAGVQAQGTDPNYPYEGGRIGVWGFGVRDFELRHPTVNSDYMSYCGQTWVSDWQWNATYKRILTLSGWGTASVAPPVKKDGGVMIGAIDPSGQQVWWTGPGKLSEGRTLSATHTVVFEFADGEVEAPAQVSVREHYPTRNIVAELPEGFEGRELLGVRLRDEDGEHESVSGAAIRRLHVSDTLKSAH